MSAHRARRTPFVLVAVAVAVLLGAGLTGCDTTSDTDGDGIPNAFETYYHLDPGNPDENTNSVLDGDEDPDGDTLTTTYETLTYQGLNPNGYTINPLDYDSDDDGWHDGQEIFYSSNPLDPSSIPNTCGAPTGDAAASCCGAPTGAADTNC